MGEEHFDDDDPDIALEAIGQLSDEERKRLEELATAADAADATGARPQPQ